MLAAPYARQGAARASSRASHFAGVGDKWAAPAGKGLAIVLTQSAHVRHNVESSARRKDTTSGSGAAPLRRRSETGRALAPQREHFLLRTPHWLLSPPQARREQYAYQGWTAFRPLGVRGVSGADGRCDHLCLDLRVSVLVGRRFHLGRLGQGARQGSAGCRRPVDSGKGKPSCAYGSDGWSAQILPRQLNFTDIRGVNPTGCAAFTYPLPAAGIKEGLCYADGPTGINSKYSTQWPNELAAAASWDRDLIYLRAAAEGAEFSRVGAAVPFSIVAGPVGRSVYDGRSWEGFGPDPFLAGEAVRATVRAFQDAGVTGLLKHFVGSMHTSL